MIAVNKEYAMMTVVIPELSKIISERMTDEDVTPGQRNIEILRYVLGMVSRGDSKETILDIYYFLSSYPEPESTPRPTYAPKA